MLVGLESSFGIGLVSTIYAYMLRDPSSIMNHNHKSGSTGI
jgi:hypothetical protein